MQNLEKWCRWTYLQGRARDADVENECVDTGRERKGRLDKLGERGCHTYMAHVCTPSHFSRVWFFVTLPSQAPLFSLWQDPQGRILEKVSMSSSRASSRPRNWTCVSYVSCIGRWVLYHWPHLGSPVYTLPCVEHVTGEKLMCKRA